MYCRYYLIYAKCIGDLKVQNLHKFFPSKCSSFIPVFLVSYRQWVAVVELKKISETLVVDQLLKTLRGYGRLMRNWRNSGSPLLSIKYGIN